MALTVLHQAFIQAMFSRRAAPVKVWKNVWKSLANILNERVSDDGFEAFWRQINDHIEDFGFRITTAIDHGIGSVLRPNDNNRSENFRGSTAIDVRTPGKMWMALVNTKSDESSKLGTDLTSIELNLFKKIVDRIILAPNYRFCISTHDAIRLSSKLNPPMKKSDSQNLLAVLVKKGWLSLSSSGFYTLSLRCQLELKSYITENYEQPPSCAACKEVVMRGYKCNNKECDKALHVICEAHQMKRTGNCPACKTKLSKDLIIGEDAIEVEMVDSEAEEDYEDENESSIRSNNSNNNNNNKNNSNKKNKNKRRRTETFRSDSGESEVETTQIQSQSQRRSRR